MTDQTFVVWTEIPVTDMARAVEFYNAVFGWTLTIDESGPNPMAIYSSGDPDCVGGHLYPGKPAGGGNGPTIHLMVDDLAAATERLKAAGGKVGPGPIEIPPGRFTYGEDLDGNSIGLFEAKAA